MFYSQFNASPRLAKKLLTGLVCVAALGLSQPLLAASSSNLYGACNVCDQKALAWSSSDFDRIYLLAESADANYLHPQNLAAEPLAKALMLLNSNAEKSPKPIFDEASSANFAAGLVAALGKATPKQEALFFVGSRIGFGAATSFLMPSLANTGRAFIDAQGLNIIFGEVQDDYFGAFRSNRMLRSYDFGSRGRAGKVKLSSNGLSHPRADWVIIPLSGSGPAAKPVNVAVPVTPVIAEPAQHQIAPILVQPAGRAAPPAVRDESFFQAQEARLKNLKKLRDQNLITEEEYQAKRREILKDL